MHDGIVIPTQCLGLCWFLANTPGTSHLTKVDAIPEFEVTSAQTIEIAPELIEAGLCVCSKWGVENVGDLAGFVRALYLEAALYSQKSPSQSQPQAADLVLVPSIVNF